MNFSIPFWKSEFVSISDYEKIFTKHKLHIGRMIGASKCMYLDQNPGNTVYFNANILTKKSSKIWYGDIDATKSFDVLKNIADELKEDLYVLSEYDCRFESENLTHNEMKSKCKVVIKHGKK